MSVPGAGAPPRPPVVVRRPRALTLHGHTRVDDYAWLRDDTRQDPEVLAFLAAQNAHTEAALAHTRQLQERLHDELRARLPQEDDSVPYFHDGYWYYRRFEAGEEHPIVARRRGTLTAPEEIVLDLDELSRPHPHYAVGAIVVSRDGRHLAYTEDTVGREQFVLRVKDLESGELLPEAIANVESSIAWANDGRTLFYVEKDPVTLLGVRVRRHLLGTDPAGDALVYEEPDHSFYLDVYKTRSDRYLMIHLKSTVATEVRFAPADEPAAPFRLFLPRERGHEYDVEDHGDRFVVLTNWRARNFRVMEAPAERTADRAAWRDVVAHREDTFLDDFEVFARYLAVAERHDGRRRIRVHPWNGGAASLIDFPEATCAFAFDTHFEQDTDELRYLYSSFTTPETTIAHDMRSGESRVLKRLPVAGGYDAAGYRSERLWAPARDGERVPVSLLYRRDLRRDGTAPLLQHAYGAYGDSTDPAFDPDLLSLVDRGFVYAIAHVRGGQEMGRAWYENGRLLRKRNTFTDFIDATEHLLAAGWGARDRVFARGRSAGGLLMAAVATLRPDLYRGILVGVPFVDVVTTMLDESIPLTANEFDEWGDPRRREFYEYMLTYSPYDQVAARPYPNLLVTTGLWDSQVQYFEPAKWVAKVQAVTTGDQRVLLSTDMQSGHGGQSGRFARLRQRAMEWAFLLDLAGVGE